MNPWFLLVYCLLATNILFAQHSIILKNGEKLEGVVMALNNDILEVAINREIKKIPLKMVSSLFFNEYVPYDGSFDPTDEMKEIRSGDYLIKYIMKDRLMVEPPAVSNATENKGTVVVDVVINKRGLVIRAEPGGVGSTTSSEYLYTKAKFAAQGARFDEAPKGPIETTGQIIITY